MVDSLENERVRGVGTDNYDYFADAPQMRMFAPNLMRHLHRYYRRRYAVAVDRHWLLARRDVPLPASKRTSVLDHRDILTSRFADRVVHPHLHYDALYHRFRGPGVGTENVLEAH